MSSHSVQNRKEHTLHASRISTNVEEEFHVHKEPAVIWKRAFQAQRCGEQTGCGEEDAAIACKDTCQFNRQIQSDRTIPILYRFISIGITSDIRSR